VNGAFYVAVQKVKKTPAVENVDFAEKLWRDTEDVIRKTLAKK
jgi:hypothetical protein